MDNGHIDKRFDGIDKKCDGLDQKLDIFIERHNEHEVELSARMAVLETKQSILWKAVFGVGSLGPISVLIYYLIQEAAGK